MDLLTETAPDTREQSPIPHKPSQPVAALDKLYSDLGGAAAIGRIIGVSTEHASAMKRRGSIPLEHWPALVMSPVSKALGITEARVLFAHTGVATGSEQKPAPATQVDEEEPKAFSCDDPALVFNVQPATRVYRNRYEQVVICQEHEDEQPFVFFQPENIPRLIDALRTAARSS